MAKSTAEKMKERLQILEAAEVELAAAEAEVQGLMRKVEEADRAVLAAKAQAVGGGWKDRQAVKAAEADRRGLAEDLERARGIEEKKRHAVEDLRDETGILKTEAASRLTRAAVEKTEALMEDIRRKQADLVETAKKAVAVRLAVASVVPRRIVSQRIPGKFFKVVSADPALKEIYKSNKPPGSFSVEPLKCLAGVRAGKWQIVEGQDLTIRPEEIETIWGDGPLPEAVDAIHKLHLGRLVGDENAREMDFQRLAASVTEEEIHQVAKELEG